MLFVTCYRYLEYFLTANIIGTFSHKFQGRFYRGMVESERILLEDIVASKTILPLVQILLVYVFE